MKKLLLLSLFSFIGFAVEAQCTANAYLGYFISGNQVTFVDSSYTSSNYYNSSNSYINFGNGNIQYLTGPNSTYTFTYTPGTYTVSMLIQDSVNASCMDSTSITFTIGSTTLSCHASFSIFADTAVIGNYYGYNSSVCTGATSTTYTWYWGDGSSSVGQFPSHTYANSGTYTICLHVSSIGLGAICQDSICSQQFIARMNGMHSITILNAPLGVHSVTTRNLSLYPSPVNNELHINLNDKISIVNVLSMTGRLMASYTAESAINVSQLAAGMYLLQVKTSQATYQSRFIKE